jgi:hypothetical protein
MTKHGLLTAATAALLAATGAGPSSAGDHYQLIRSAGLTVEQAQAMTLDEIVANKFSRESTDGEQPIRPGARLNPARTVIATSGAPATHMSATATAR